MNNTKLEPCPFCGEAEDDNLELTYPRSEGVYQIECLYCGASVFDNTKEDVIEKWNTRTIDSKKYELLKRLDENVKKEVERLKDKEFRDYTENRLIVTLMSLYNE